MNEIHDIHHTTNFSSLVDLSFEIFTRRNPVTSTNMGLGEHNGDWPDISADGVKDDIALIRTIQQQLQILEHSIADEDLPDFTYFKWLMEYNLLELDELQYWKHNPRVSGMILSGLNGILVKEHFTNEAKILNIQSRLNKIPKLVQMIRSRITMPVKLWVISEIKSIGMLPEFLKSIPHQIQFTPSDLEEYNSSLKQTIKILENYRTWLENLPSSNEIPIKTQVYEKLIRLRNMGVSIKEIENLGNQYLSQTQIDLTELCHMLGGDGIEQTRRKIRQKHAGSYGKILENYQKIASKAREFLIENDILTMPQEELIIIFTPPPMRHLLSIAAASPPGQFDTPQRGFFWLTPHENPKMMEEHSFAYQSLLINHESLPGHHVHGVCKNMHPSKVRSSIFINPSPNSGLMYPAKIAEITEGWGLYTEKMMYDHGFNHDLEDPDLERKFLMINALRWRATRMIIDVNLHSGKFSVDEAVQFLQEKTGFNEATCIAEVLMYSQSPGYFLSYLLGRHLVIGLKNKLGSRYKEKTFHDTLMYAGNVPYWFIKKFEFAI